MATQVLVIESSTTPTPHALSSPRRRRIAWGPVLRHVILAVFAVVILFPILWVPLLSRGLQEGALKG
jgi:hypothetical protein